MDQNRDFSFSGVTDLHTVLARVYLDLQHFLQVIIGQVVQVERRLLQFLQHLWALNPKVIHLAINDHLIVLNGKTLKTFPLKSELPPHLNRLILNFFAEVLLLPNLTLFSLLPRSVKTLQPLQTLPLFSILFLTLDQNSRKMQ